MLYYVNVVCVNNYVTLCIPHGNYMYLIFSETPSMTVLELTINQLLTNTIIVYVIISGRLILQQIPLPATEGVLLLYVAYLHKQNLSYSSVQVYLSVVRSLHIFQGFNNPLDGCLRLKQAIKAVHIEQGDSRQKLPITFYILQKMQPLVITL